jgi:hypothetical protein
MSAACLAATRVLLIALGDPIRGPLVDVLGALDESNVENY